jgi:hypothetical protein
MTNFEIYNDKIAYIAISAVDAAAISVVSSDPAKMTATIGVMPSAPGDALPAIILTPMVKMALGLVVTKIDTVANTHEILIVDIIADPVSKSTVLDTTSVVFVDQAVPVEVPAASVAKPTETVALAPVSAHIESNVPFHADMGEPKKVPAM